MPGGSHGPTGSTARYIISCLGAYHRLATFAEPLLGYGKRNRRKTASNRPTVYKPDRACMGADSLGVHNLPHPLKPRVSGAHLNNRSREEEAWRTILTNPMTLVGPFQAAFFASIFASSLRILLTPSHSRLESKWIGSCIFVVWTVYTFLVSRPTMAPPAVPPDLKRAGRLRSECYPLRQRGNVIGTGRVALGGPQPVRVRRLPLGVENPGILSAVCGRGGDC